MAIIYKITNDINGKIYIGQTSYSLEKRFKEHCSDSRKEGLEIRPLYRAMRKYGIEHFHIESLEETNNPNERETYWIERLNSYGNGNYNATKGGDGKTLYNHNEILSRLRDYPYPKQVAEEFGCSVDIVRDIAKANSIQTRSASIDGLVKSAVNEKKSVIAYTKDDIEVAKFESTSEAAKWCVENKLATTLNSGVRAHIAEAANGKRKTAYKHKWKYVSGGLS